ncbi:MAG: polysaccharide biosynthesis C-terminal domain-containing protein [Oscillospiraceae bacterium]|nr:polysaccharide biosynthesis C-terminal domain-containing protein [Oscillospiraceae bacterium]MDD4367938.1 polysaccharide biosynthesis C-terminal domain-containing protein [Oscillospiraceae bacterium]
MTENNRLKSGKDQTLMRRLVIYFLGNLSTKVINLILTRLQITSINTESYGPVNLYVSTVPQLVSIFYLEIWAGVMRFMFDETDTDGKHKAFSNALVLAGFLSPLFIVSIVVLSGSGGDWTYTPYLILMGLLTLLDYLYQFSCRGIGRDKLYAVTGIISSLIMGLAQIILLTVFQMGALAVIISPMIGSLVSITIYESQTRQMRRFRRQELSAGYIKNLLRFCFPLSINAAAYFALTKFNQLYVQQQPGGKLALSQLEAANKVGLFVTLFVTVFSLAWQETAFAVSNDDNRVAFYSLTLNRYLKILSVAVICMIPAGRFIAWVLGADSIYGEAAIRLIPGVLAGVALSALSNFFGNIFSAEKRNTPLLYSTILGALVNIVAMLGLYRYLGLQAANVSLCLGFLATVICRYLILKKIVGLKLDPAVMWLAIAGSLLATVLFYAFPSLKIQSLLAVPFMALALFWLRPEIRQILLILQSRSRRAG